MNKFQKIALQCAKHDYYTKGFDFGSVKETQKEYVYIFKKNKFTLEEALNYKENIKGELSSGITYEWYLLKMKEWKKRKKFDIYYNAWNRS